MLCYKKALFTTLLAGTLISASAAKPRLKVAGDGFPTGQGTPEGAATDLARAFATHDALWFRRVCVRPYGAGRARDEYTEYLKWCLRASRARKQESSSDSPKGIVKVFAARHLSKNGPASYGYASFDFRDIMFVDVEVELLSGQKLSRRTMVIQDRNGQWYTHPAPDVSPLLSDGLFDERPSNQLFSSAYEGER